MSTPVTSNDTITIFMATVREKPVQINVTRKAGTSNWIAGSAGIRGIVMSTRGAQQAAQMFSDSICGSTVVEVQLTPVAPPPPPSSKKEQFEDLLYIYTRYVPSGNDQLHFAALELTNFVHALIEKNEKLESKCALLENELFMAKHRG